MVSISKTNQFSSQVTQNYFAWLARDYLRLHDKVKGVINAMRKLQTSDLITPALLIDLKRLENNLRSMAEKAEYNGVNLRPHIKTHKCIEIGMKQLEYGAHGVTVSTMEEARVFADAGFDDITYAVPLVPNKFDSVQHVSQKAHLNVLLDNENIVEQLNTFCNRTEISLDVFVKVDCGYPRCGISPEGQAAINFVKRIVEKPHLDFKGILTHAGHSYNATTVDEIKKIARHEQDVMIRFAKALTAESNKLSPEVVSIGSTPTVCFTDTFQEGITEIRPGNYVFFDYTQVALGSCKVKDCALTVVSSVISTNPGRFIIDAGATALSKDLGPTHIEQTPCYGKIFKDYDRVELDSGVLIESLSQEHGKVVYQESASKKYDFGEMVRILPNHSCLTANLSDKYQVVKDDVVLDEWKVHRVRTA